MSRASFDPVILIYISAVIAIITLIRDLIYGYFDVWSLLSAVGWTFCAVVWYRRRQKEKAEATEK